VARWKRTARRMRRRPRVISRNRHHAQLREKAYRRRIQSLNKENRQLQKKILEQERKTVLEAEKNTVYHQSKKAKNEIFKVLSPSLGNIDVDSSQIATGLAILPWAVIGLALITREG